MLHPALLLSLGFFLLGVPASSMAGSSPSILSADQIHAALDNDSGWRVVKLNAKGGVDVYRKDVDGLAVPCFKGVKVVDVDPDLLFDAIMDFTSHAGLSDDIPLVRSTVLDSAPARVRAFQYLDVPGWTLANDRYWFVEAREVRQVAGVRGHHKQTWSNLDAAPYQDQLAWARARDDDSVLVELNHGSWEVLPREDGTSDLIYRVVSDPGGRLPKSAQALATGRTLPDNLLQFEAEAKRRQGGSP